MDVVFANEPAAHGTQALRSGEDSEPGAQSVHEELPARGACVPGTQASHAVAVAEGRYVPRGHGEMLAASVATRYPGGASMHAEDAAVAVYVPAAQGVHASMSENVPGGHTVQRDAAAALTLPGVHCRQLVLPDTVE